MTKADKKGRSKGGGAFLQLHHFMLQSQAWRSLTPADRAVYTVIATLYNGANNGRLGLGARRAAELANISKNTAPACFRRLIERGFIECASPGGFNIKVRHQTEWRLTQYKCDATGALPSKAFMRWRPGAVETPAKCRSRYQSGDFTVPIEGQSLLKSMLTVPRLVPSA